MHLVSLAAVTWDFKLVGRTRMLTEAWMRADQPTTFVQVPTYRAALQQLRTPLRRTEGVSVLNCWPVVYPRRCWRRLPESWLCRAIQRRARALRRRLDRVLDWDQAVAIVVSPLWAPWLDVLPFRHVVYDCIDDLAVHVPRPELTSLYRQWEEDLIERISGATIVAERLGERIRRQRPELPIAMVRNGVDADWFRQVAAGATRPADVPHNNRPVVGFVGALYEWIDWHLMEQTARAMPECDFVCIGPHDGRGDVGLIASLPNMYLLGPRAYEQVPAYIQAFDVCWVPFKTGAVAAAANPVKIYEYLSLGKPVVSTPVGDPDSFDHLVAVARTPAEMVVLLRMAIENPASDAGKRIAFAQAHSWDARAEAMVDFVSTLDRLRAGKLPANRRV